MALNSKFLLENYPQKNKTKIKNSRNSTKSRQKLKSIWVIFLLFNCCKCNCWRSDKHCFQIFQICLIVLFSVKMFLSMNELYTLTAFSFGVGINELISVYCALIGNLFPCTISGQ